MELNLSVIKRTSSSADQVKGELKSGGFIERKEIMDGRVSHHENSLGIGMTVVDGPMGTLVVPSGPVRGLLMGENAVGIGDAFPDVKGFMKEEKSEEEELISRGKDDKKSYNI